jgi:hypothetical protein
VSTPPGSSSPFSRADVEETELAAPVVAIGAPPGVNVRSSARLVPASLVATRRKW